METEGKILSSLNYFSIFFAPFLFPLIVYFVAADKEVTYHAKRALISHIIPFIVILLAIIIGAVFSMSNSIGLATGTIVTGLLTAGILYIVYLIWNIIQGLKMFM
ncbi:DUF4870 domain-containing protein [Lentibacillus sp. N15]|uniref:DUF4870 domain-containing protein n=1 Tax=Lentibacillus songyuanensis TaxID=3136161 RepID=UPI0031BAC950